MIHRDQVFWDKGGWYVAYAGQTHGPHTLKQDAMDQMDDLVFADVKAVQMLPEPKKPKYTLADNDASVICDD